MSRTQRVPWHACNLTLNFDAVQESCGRIQRGPYEYMIMYLSMSIYNLFGRENFLEKRFILRKSEP
jgi:hypothetical protein